MKRSLSFLFILTTALLFTNCRGIINPNEWVVTTPDCWNNIFVQEAGEPIPRLFTACDRMIILPATYLAAEFSTETKFADRLAGNVQLTYQWRIIDPKKFVGAAKSIVSAQTSSDDQKVDPDALEAIENSVVDKMLINIIREFTPKVDALNIDELALEIALGDLAAKSNRERGIEFANISVNVDLSPQAEEALDVISALNFYKANDEEELGREIIKAKAGATNITVKK